MSKVQCHYTGNKTMEFANLWLFIQNQFPAPVKGSATFSITSNQD